MKINVIALVAALFLSFCGFSAQSQTVIDTFSAAGGAWTPSNQPSFSILTGGTLYTDEAIGSGTNTALLNTGTTWSSIVTPPGQGLYEDFYYTLFDTPVITLNTTNVLAGVQTITFTLNVSLQTSNPMNINSMGLNFNGVQAPSDFSFVSSGADPDAPFPGSGNFTYTWVWDVSELTAPGSFSLAWTTPGEHTAYYSAELLQAVPEPSTYVMVVAGLGLIFVLRRRFTTATA